MSDQHKEIEDEEQILKDTKSQQSDEYELDDSTTNLLFDLENESGELFTSSAINEGDSISPRFELQTFLETTEKVTADDWSGASADTNTKHEPHRTSDLRHFRKLFAANKPVAGIDGNMDEEGNAKLNMSSEEKEVEPKNTLDQDRIHDVQPAYASSQEEAAVFGDTPSKKRKAANRPSTKVNEIQSVLSSQHKSYIEPSKQDVTTILDDPAFNKRMKND
ncbi:unnamed protein product [Aureobasidium pullulans]|nr:unnamed protein product [Aureobasidium pullulans]